MRKILISIFIFVAFTLTAQVRLDKPEMYIGANFGVTESMTMFNPAVSQGFLKGYNGGIVFRYIAEKGVGMQAELNFSQRGWAESTGLYTRQLNYIELPFLTHIYMGNKNRFFINLGPKISLLISDKAIVNQIPSTALVQEETKAIQNPFDYGLCGGIGVLFNIKGSIFQLDTRVYYGLSDVFANSKADYFSNSNNFNLSVNLAYLLKVK
ncbi:MAG: porin family protein [Paludibacter sp.]|nr:porin family protein [Paludibacter sp.]